MRTTSTGRVQGVGLQFNPTIVDELGSHEFFHCNLDFAELLVDTFVAPMDCGYLIDPNVLATLEDLGNHFPLLAHSNYGGEFGFEPLEETAASLRHVPFARAIGSPWVADHLFYGHAASASIWSSPLQFSEREAIRVADRAAALQDMLGVPLLHEDAFYYAPFPGSTISAGEFIAEVVERAGTYMLLDLHNVHTNAVDHADFDAARYLDTIPLDRVIEVHVAGGQWLEGWYHDFHNSPVPEAVWAMLDATLPRMPNLQAIVLEMQGPAHNARSTAVDPSWVDIARSDLERAGRVWADVVAARPTATADEPG